MDIAKTLVTRARESGAIRDKVTFFSVTDKKKIDAGGGNMVDVEVPNGIHYVTVLSEKIGKGKSFSGEEQDELQMVISDKHKGKTEQKLWNVAVKSEDGKLHYIIEALEHIEKGEEFIVEAFKMRNGKYGKSISKVVGGAPKDELPTVQLNDDLGETSLPPLSATDEIDPKDIPF